MLNRSTMLLAGVLLAIVGAGIIFFGPERAGADRTEAKPLPIPTPKGAKASERTNPVMFVTDWDGTKLERSDVEWKGLLTKLEYYVLREKGTEEPYTGKLTSNKMAGTYHCAACGLALFSSRHKFDSQTGWPSFYQPIDKRHIAEIEDRSIPEELRTEVVCARCESHQGHVFDDGPEPTGLRYCINSAALRFSASK